LSLDKQYAAAYSPELKSACLRTTDVEEHRFSYPTVIPLQLGASAHSPRTADLGQGAAQVRLSAAEPLGSPIAALLTAAERGRNSTVAQLRPYAAS
jgi:hypothetical protein